MKRVLIESPYAGDVLRNVIYARMCTRDSLERGEAPLASHLLYTQEGILNDAIGTERTSGVRAGWAWGVGAEASVIYIDYGISEGMKDGIRKAVDEERPIFSRRLFGDKRGLSVEKILNLIEMYEAVLSVRNIQKKRLEKNDSFSSISVSRDDLLMHAHSLCDYAQTAVHRLTAIQMYLVFAGWYTAKEIQTQTERLRDAGENHVAN